MKTTKGLFLFTICFCWLQCSNVTDGKGKRNFAKNENKINGVSFVAPPKEIGKKEIIQPLEVVSANYLSIMPYSFIPENSSELIFDSKWQWWGEKTQGTIKIIETAKSLGYGIMLKPHVWKRHGEFTGEHTYGKEEDWLKFEDSFSKYILHYAKIADSLGVSIFCLGTEWEKFVVARPVFWKKLIKEIRGVYSGKLTYASNWDEFNKVPFWEELDFIGVDGYFPLVNTTTPTEEEVEKGLVPFKNELKQLSDSVNRKVLFTEYGFRSRNNTAFKPWESDRSGEVNLVGQVNGYQGFFRSFWKEEFIAGGFLWKWFSNHNEVGGLNNNGFTPQNKPVEKTIKERYQN